MRVPWTARRSNQSILKERNAMDLTVAEDIKKKWQEYTEELYKKIFMTQIITMVITHLEPDIL